MLVWDAAIFQLKPDMKNCLVSQNKALNKLAQSSFIFTFELISNLKDMH